MQFEQRAYEGGASREDVDAALVSPETGLVNNYNGNHLGAYFMGAELLYRALESGSQTQIDLARDVAKVAFVEPLQTYDGYLRAQFPSVSNKLIESSDKEKVAQVSKLTEGLRPLIGKLSEALSAGEPVTLADVKSALIILKNIRVLFKDTVLEESF